MRSFFNMEGPLFTFLSKVADIMMLNIIFLICCIPIVTIGASLTAMSYVTLKMKEGLEGYIWKSFFKSFKENFKQSTVIWLIMFVIGLILGIDVLLLRQMSANGQSGSHIMWYLIIVGIVIWFCVFLYVFPLQARFYNPVKNTLRNALLVAAANAPKTLLMIVVIVGSVVLTFFSNATFAWGLLIWMLGGFAILSYINSSLQIGIIHRMSGPAAQEDEEKDPDAWEVPEEPDAVHEPEAASGSNTSGIQEPEAPADNNTADIQRAENSAESTPSSLSKTAAADEEAPDQQTP